MNVFIKSFNRPYYLDRCLQSILLNVIDDNLSIIILDDGTHPKYLKKIKDKYPNVSIKLSPFYDEKVKKIEKFISHGEVIKEMEIPTQFWLSSINESKDKYFILLEDDFWFKEKINIDEIYNLLETNKLCMLKLFYFGNPRLISGKLKEISKTINEIKPSFLIKNEFLFKKVFLGNPFKIWSILHRLRIKNKSKINYYTIYHVAGAIFSKKYYSHLWKDFTGVVNEDEQLIKALNFYNTEKNVRYGVVKKDVVTTSFSSSATNMFEGIDFNPFIYNDILNRSWFADELNPMSGYPQDILEDDIVKILNKNTDKLIPVDNWRKWANRFKNQYKEVGFQI
ncbi:glycosyltransferase [Flavobacterium anhuiense]|uniref:glycosyltransferase n=1 Tax=Flavobacterium anhuiense TaxID=459526 RepID=UPI0034D97110